MPGTRAVIPQLARDRLVPVAVIEDAAHAVGLGQALLAGGLSTVEVTFRTDAAVASIRALAAETDLLVGAGTVRTRQQVDDALAAGARYIVSPGFSPAVVRHCRELGVLVLPGVATPTEVMAAMDEGVEVVKFFPAEQYGGVATLKALGGPFGSVRFVPTGGITAALLPAYLALPSVLAVGGSWMVAPALVSKQDWDAVTRLTAEAVAEVRRAAA
jgi:2-dehydro-3-deoxyphosphogluconate aldolase / (4S)-4-hydroxy-2-oxoglutarate aldolase